MPGRHKADSEQLKEADHTRRPAAFNKHGSQTNAMDVVTKAETILRIVKHGETPELMRQLANRMYSDDVAFILRRDLTVPSPHRNGAKIPINIRPMQPSDIPAIVVERPRRLPMLRADIPTCYLATTEDGSICYMVWMIRYEQQRRVRPYFKGDLQVYHSDTVLLEFSYTFERFRGLGIMTEALSRITELGPALGARWAIAYVVHDNVASLKGCAAVGFRPYQVRNEKWRGIRVNSTYQLLPPDTLYSFEKVSAR
jgi:RimJ/RimL family protein N-acetyltransferase